MATVKEIVQDIKDTFDCSIINQTQASKYLGMGKEKARQFLAPIPAYPTGKEIKYHAIDIAKLLESIRTCIPHGNY